MLGTVDNISIIVRGENNKKVNREVGIERNKNIHINSYFFNSYQIAIVLQPLLFHLSKNF